ncbi:ATP-dependent RNA helicase drs1-like [Teratosphaeria destructans]|uniref:RNA helicase n=1 Tax=Teratosphaeria destructans TaxID=418781 RepID=A0A9W7W087_9PEZI|nr:ATP-dependent RNA helicase drs1-like [Teratosphaeria destructans]
MAPLLDPDFVGTLSDDDVSDEEAEVERPKRKRGSTGGGAVKRLKMDVASGADGGGDGDDLDSEFEFDQEGRVVALGDFEGWGGAVEDRVDTIVARRMGGLGGVEGEEESAEEEEEEEEEADLGELGQSDVEEEIDVGHGHYDEESDAESAAEEQDDDADEQEEEDVAAPVSHPDDEEATASDDDADVDEVERKKQAAFFAPAEKTKHETPVAGEGSFTSMNLSRPILKGLSAVGFTAPTPIQKKTIPVALEGKDIVGGAVTGSGKTGAFVIPILERLLYRPKRQATTRVAILMPTRELALQCLAVAKKLAAHTDITFGRAIGGLNSREQEKELKLRPDIVIATPGRFIDFMRNSPSFQTDKLEILVLDEADRMLEEGFSDELNEILKTIPKSRQTMLFSATMTTKVDELVRVGMQRPVRLMVDAQKASASGLTQEFVRLRPGREQKRLGYLMYLCAEVHTDRVIIFFRQKKEAHRVRILFALCGLKAAELHGDLSQEQRINAVESFRSGRAAFLLATDVASRGLDIKGIEVVVNYEAPQTHEIYLHRVGRTARAGRRGISCTLAAEPDRKVVKAAVKAAKSQGAGVRQRTVDPKDADAWQRRCDDLREEVEAVLKEEKEDRLLQQTEKEITRAENNVVHRAEILARARRGRE